MNLPDFSSPLFWGVMIGWILSVGLHEFGHGIVAYWGGDYTIRERGGLTLNPFQFVDPIMSIALPIVFLMMGGVPLPGGATYVRHDLLRSRAWESAVSAAGPAMNLIAFFVLMIPLNSRMGWIDPAVPVQQWTNAQIFVGAMAILQLVAVALNLFPVPPLDGFGIIEPYLPGLWRAKLSSPQIRQTLFIIYFILLWRGPLGNYIWLTSIRYIDQLGGRGLGFDCYDAFRHAMGFIK